MDDRKLIVFDRFELVLVIIFVLVLAISCFTLGYKYGKYVSLEQAGITEQDVIAVEQLQAKEEVEAQQVVEEIQQAQDSQGESEEKVETESTDGLDDLKREFEQISKEGAPAPAKDKKIEIDTAALEEVVDSYKVAPEKVVAQDIAASGPSPEEVKASLKGKYTVQLGSFQTLKDAQTFAEGFVVRGYAPIVNEVEIKGKGTWFRVSLGGFSNVKEAKDYISKEQSLFEGQDYVITVIQ